MKLSLNETATILAALRYWQDATSTEGGNDPRELSPEHFTHATPLDPEAIDALCERINEPGGTHGAGFTTDDYAYMHALVDAEASFEPESRHLPDDDIRRGSVLRKLARRART